MKLLKKHILELETLSREIKNNLNQMQCGLGFFGCGEQTLKKIERSRYLIDEVDNMFDGIGHKNLNKKQLLLHKRFQKVATELEFSLMDDAEEVAEFGEGFENYLREGHGIISSDSNSDDICDMFV